MAIYGRHREQWDPTRRKSKTSKNKTYEIKTVARPNFVTANPDSDTGTESAQDTNNWYYASGNATGNNNSEDPSQPFSGVPIDTGGTYENEIYSFTGGGAERILAYKQPTVKETTVTVTLKIIECGGGNGAVPQRIKLPNPSSTASGAYMSSGTYNWIGNFTTMGPYKPIQIAYTTTAPGTTGNGQNWDGSATWTPIAGTDMHGHSAPLPTGVIAANIDRTEFKSFSFTFTVPAGAYIACLLYTSPSPRD